MVRSATSGPQARLHVGRLGRPSEALAQPIGRERKSSSSGIPEQVDMQPVTHPESMFKAKRDEPFLTFAQCFAVRTFGHQEDASWRDGMGADKYFDFLQIPLALQSRI